jgi:hypothetical protein
MAGTSFFHSPVETHIVLLYLPPEWISKEDQTEKTSVFTLRESRNHPREFWTPF